MRLNNKSKKKQRGQSLTEYLILVALIAVSSIGIVRLLGKTTQVQLANITRALQGGQGKIKHEKVKDSLYSKKDLSTFMNNTSSRSEE